MDRNLSHGARMAIQYHARGKSTRKRQAISLPNQN